MMRFLVGWCNGNWRNTSELTPQMNYSYAQCWLYELTGRREELIYRIDLNACPHFFAYGNEAMSSFPTVSNVIRIQFPTDAWLDEI